ncbi:MAG: ABC transporter ATP-binding protein [Kiritimatiellia bacterium]|jgi:ABC-2 type transport system ATP-binding protein|nr:ABC transporter ATP-binding protein [Kiritimatiellia bacterium]MDP6811344.1 ABC transporter ATP-binding protein [Kiritimatiellia bacterium]MDP7024385.1 ABC transporter ATP-binding protein [Kiritimatiellia bacterium]
MEHAIEMRSVTVRFPSRGGEVTALEGLDLTVAPGQVFGFLGPNGAGKTTAMHVLLGFIEANEGEARLFGRDVRESIARQRIGYLPEHPDTYRFLTGRELLDVTASLFRLDRRTRRQRIGEAIEAAGLQGAVSRRIATYSRGMMQRICLAQALINDPDLVILDEPTGGLDPIGRRDIRRIIGELRDRGKTVFFSSHELSEVELVCDTLAILANGRIAVQGPAASLVAPGERLEKVFMKVIADAEAST